jgi:hypothetical protein
MAHAADPPAVAAETPRPKPTSKTAGHATQQVEDARRRAVEARRSGDATHAALLDALAAEWTQVGVELERAAAMERRAERAQREAAEIETRALRARALVEQTIARVGRAREKLEGLSRERPELELPASPPAPDPAAGSKPKADPAAQKGKP